MTKLTVAFGSFFLKGPKIAEVNDWMQETEALTEEISHSLSSCVELCCSAGICELYLLGARFESAPR